MEIFKTIITIPTKNHAYAKVGRVPSIFKVGKKKKPWIILTQIESIISSDFREWFVCPENYFQ